MEFKAFRKQTGGAEQEATIRREKIYSWEEQTSVEGTVYYISPFGHDDNIGTSPNAPLQTIEGINKLSLTVGDAVLFERDGVYRTSVPLMLQSGVTYGTYGEGEKPIISGSLKNYAKEACWCEETNHIWSTDVSDEAGLITFEDDTVVGIRKYTLEDLRENGDYFHNLQEKKLYLFSKDSSPSVAFDTIEIGSIEDLFIGYHVHDLKIFNLVLKYAGRHGMSLGDNRDVFVSGCEIGWIGGKIYDWSSKVRLGNGIQFWNECHNVMISHCYFYQIYDAAFTFQGRYPQGNAYTDVTFAECLVEYCCMNLEFWGSDQETGFKSGDAVEIRNILFANNILRFSGYGWGGLQRPDTGSQAFLLGWDYTYSVGKVNNFVIRDNIFDCADGYFIWSNLIFTLDGNCYYQKQVSGRNGCAEIQRGTGHYVTNQETFEEGVLAFEKKPARIQWLG